MSAKTPVRETTAMRATAGALAVAVLSLLSGVEFYSTGVQVNRAVRDPYGIALAEGRLAVARGTIPAGARVAYLSDLDQESEIGRASRQATQYALAPRLLTDPERENNPAWGIGNFAKAELAGPAAQRVGLEISQELARGVFLFRRAGAAPSSPAKVGR